MSARISRRSVQQRARRKLLARTPLGACSSSNKVPIIGPAAGEQVALGSVTSAPRVKRRYPCRPHNAMLACGETPYDALVFAIDGRPRPDHHILVQNGVPNSCTSCDSDSRQNYRILNPTARLNSTLCETTDR